MMEKMENKMNVRDEEEASDSDRGTEAGSDQEADEDDRDAEGPEVPAGPNGMFLFSLLYISVQ